MYFYRNQSTDLEEVSINDFCDGLIRIMRQERRKKWRYTMNLRIKLL